MSLIQGLQYFSPTSWFAHPRNDQLPSTACCLEAKPMREETNVGSASKSKLKDGYNSHVDELRDQEYPQLRGAVYLDHAGTTLYAASLINSVSQELLSNIFGNPHSQSPSSQLTTRRIEDVRLRVLRLLNADPDNFDIVFCANATSGIKLVVELMTVEKNGFKYRFHKDAHTSVVGVRELAASTDYFASDEAVELWLTEKEAGGATGLFAWPAQSNFSGRRLPRDWAVRLRESHPNYFSLLDAASIVTTSSIDLNSISPDFTVLSFYKMFGFPDLGALIVRKSSPPIHKLLERRRYFGGGTVAAVVAAQCQPFHVKRSDAPHQQLEDGTPAFHSILALDHAMSTHEKLYGGFSSISAHTSCLISYLYQALSQLMHGNGSKLCTIYSESGHFGHPISQGPIICFNIKRSDGTWIGYSEVEKLAAIKKIHIRTGGLCNPGGVESYIGLQPQEIMQNYEAGHQCWDDQDVMRGKPTGAIRVSLGAMSTLNDIEKFIKFLEEFYVDRDNSSVSSRSRMNGSLEGTATAIVESLNIYPIKSCGGFKIPDGVTWELQPHGLMWDREWCVIHLGTGLAIDQKRYPKMALIRPFIDLPSGVLVVTATGSTKLISVPLNSIGDESNDRSVTANNYTLKQETKLCPSRVCGDQITAISYRSPKIVDFFSEVIGTPCTLARFPSSGISQRYFKPHLEVPNSAKKISQLPGLDAIKSLKPILLSNESPILIINRSSINKLNEDIQSFSNHNTAPPKLARAEVFRANVVISPIPNIPNTACLPFAEDSWSHIQIDNEFFELLGPCRRCHMVCIDQDTGERNEEPLVTLNKTRRAEGGRVVFGQHAAHLTKRTKSGDSVKPTIKVGDLVRAWGD